MADPRSAALTVLEKCRRSGAWSDAVLGSVMDAEGLKGPDRGLCTALCYGVIQQRSWLDYALSSASNLPLHKVEPKVLDILRISLYQLMFLRRVPAYAAVSEGVGLCRSLGYARAAGYVNAVLRSLSRLEQMPEPGGSGEERLSIITSHPLWLVREMIARLGEEEAKAYLKANNSIPPVCLQVNTLRITAEALKSRLAEEGIGTEPDAFLPDCLNVSDPGDLRRCAAFQEGMFYVQDAAAKLSVLTAAPRAGERVLDLCAAPGGKSFAAAIAAGGGASIFACDLHENKLKRIQASAARLGLSLETTAGDARINRPEWNGGFDLVIADVPCSGLGVIRKKPDIRWKDPAEFTALPDIQSDILRNAARYVRPGGRLLYTTCTVRREENEDVAGAFLDSAPDFAPLAFSTPFGDRSECGMLQLWPQRQGTDGFFISLMRKNV